MDYETAENLEYLIDGYGVLNVDKLKYSHIYACFYSMILYGECSLNSKFINEDKTCIINGKRVHINTLKRLTYNNPKKFRNNTIMIHTLSKCRTIYKYVLIRFIQTQVVIPIKDLILACHNTLKIMKKITRGQIILNSVYTLYNILERLKLKINEKCQLLDNSTTVKLRSSLLEYSKNLHQLHSTLIIAISPWNTIMAIDTTMAIEQFINEFYSVLELYNKLNSLNY